MNKRIWTGLLPVALLSALALTPGNRTYTVAPESRLWLEGTSTVRDFRCDAKRIDGGLTADPAAPALAVDDLQAAVKAVQIHVPVALLDCGNGTMNDHMWKALDAKKHAFIRYEHTKHEVTPRADGTALVKMAGKLTINGTTRPIELTATATAEKGGLRVRGTEELKMTDYGVTPPKLMLGTLKVHDPVKVGFEVVLK